MLLTERLVRHANTLTASERALADGLMRGYPDSVLDSASAMATAVGTSASTVVRLFAKLGYASLAEVRREARGVVSTRLHSAGQRASATLGAHRSLNECIDDALLHDQHNLAATREGIDLPVFAKVVECLSQTQGRLFVMAEKNSAPIGAYLVAHLNMCRSGVHDLSAGAPAVVDKLLWVEPPDVLLVFTIRRYSASALHAARHFRRQGCEVLALTDGPAAPVIEHASHWLQVHTANASPFDSYTAAFFLCNALVSAVAQGRSEEVSQALQRRDALWQGFQKDLVLDPVRPANPAR